MLKNKRVFITGCSRGIGNAMMTVFAENGAIVYANAREKGCLDEYVNKECNTGKIIPVYFDVCDKKAVKNCMLQIKKEQGCLDVLVNNAGIMEDALLGMIGEDAVFRIFETNVFAVIQMTQMALKLIKRSNRGSIVNMASIVGLEGNAGQTVYAASKGAVANLTKTWARELVKDGIRVNAIAPGKINTDMYQSIGADKVQAGIQEIGMGRLGEPKEIANVAMFLASDMASYVTGEIISVNGGWFL